jgi:hypothetical protein
LKRREPVISPRSNVSDDHFIYILSMSLSTEIFQVPDLPDTGDMTKGKGKRIGSPLAKANQKKVAKSLPRPLLFADEDTRDPGNFDLLEGQNKDKQLGLPRQVALPRRSRK